MSKVIGIDLGTTSARVAVMENGAPVILENSEGEGTTPCYVAITEDGQRLVGEAARRYALRNSASVAYAVKRFIGRRYDEPEVALIKRFMPFEIASAPNGDAWVRLQGRLYSPIQICAFVLQKMKQTAEDYLRAPVTQAVITVPAFFNDAQRQATREAGKIAGLQVLRIINEPTAAALAYGLGRSDSDFVAVYDLGGGTFDVSLLEIGDGVFETFSTHGDMMLGGEDFDYEIANHLAAEFSRTHNVDLMGDPIARLRLKQAAETAKFELSHKEIAYIDLPFVTARDGSSLHLQTTLSRQKFEQMIEPIVDRSIAVCKRACADADGKSVHKVILVGGSTRIPIVTRKIEEFFKLKPYGALRREDAVALGAAVQAGMLQGEVKDAVLLDCMSMSLGIETQGGVFVPLIHRNTTIPAKKSQMFSTAQDNQSAVDIKIFQGDALLVADNKLLGTLTLDGIPPAKKGEPQIEVTLDIDANGILSASAKNKATNKESSVRIKVSGGLNDEEVATLQTDAARTKIAEPKFSRVHEMGTTPQARKRTVDSETQAPSIKPSAAPLDEKARIFVSYAHEDTAWAQQITKALSLLKRNGKVDVWVDRHIQTGDLWKTEIFEAISRSNVAVLLLSNDFFNSDFILDTELPMVFAEKERRRLTLVPVMVRPCPFELHQELSKFQLFNSPEQPLAALEAWRAEEELSRLAREIAKPFQQ